MCALTGLQPLSIDSADGTFTPEQLDATLPDDDIHQPRRRIVALENTHNRCGGTIWPLELLRDVCRRGHEHGLAVHLDGARLWNACVATGTQPADWLADADSVSMCFSKGLGAPVGSCIAGSSEFIARCRFFRKLFGGQMRQAGVLAAAALHGIEQHWARMAEDHANASELADMIAAAPGLRCLPVATNIVIVEVGRASAPAGERPETAALPTPAAALSDALAELGVAVFDIAPNRVRAVTHLDVTTEQVRQAGAAFQRAAERLGTTATA